MSNGHHPSIGRIDLAHIPLQTLSQYYPDVFEKIQNYDTFAIVRDPFKRFSSSLFQWLSMHRASDVRSVPVQELAEATDEAIKRLENFKSDDTLSYEFIHFQSQLSYLDLEGHRVVKHVFDMADLSGFYATVNECLGGVWPDTVSLSQKQIGTATFYRSHTARAVGTMLGPKGMAKIANILPESVKRQVRRIVFEPKADRFRDIIESDRVVNFVKHYYAQDITLYEEVRAGNSV